MAADACTLIHLRGEYLRKLRYDFTTCEDTFNKYFDYYFARNCSSVNPPCPNFKTFTCTNTLESDCDFSTSIGAENINCTNITVSVT